MKLNRKGYLTVEIILASVITFVIAFFLIEITMKLVNKTDDAYNDTLFYTDKALVTKNLKEEIEKDIIKNGKITNVTTLCDSITISNTNNNKKISYGTYSKKIDNKLKIESKTCTSSSDSKYIFIKIPLSNAFIENGKYDINIIIDNS